MMTSQCQLNGEGGIFWIKDDCLGWAGPEPSYLALGNRITLVCAIGVLDEAENFFQFSHPSSCKVAT